MEALNLRKLTTWLKHGLAKDKSVNQSFSTWTCNHVTPEACTCGVTSPQSGRKRKISWEIFHPLKQRRLEKEEREPTDCVRANFGLKKVHGAMFPGHQSTATSLCAILRAQSTPPSAWTPEVIDKVLLQGDRLHTVRVCHLGNHRFGEFSLSPEEMPSQIALNQIEYSLTMKHEVTVTSASSSAKLDHRKTLSAVLRRCFQEGKSGILLDTGNSTFSLFEDGTNFYLFNPTKKVHHVSLCTNLIATLSKFRDVEHVCNFLCHKMSAGDSWRVWSVKLTADCDTWSHISTIPHHPSV